MHHLSAGSVKFILGWALVFAIRLLPFRPPNVEPMLAVMMPYAKHYGAIPTFLFGFLAIGLFDLVWGALGIWTLVTAIAYGLLGIGAFFFFKNRESTTKNYLIYGVGGTVLYDAVTGLSVGPLFFGQPFMAALVGQIPFTLMHIAGTIAFVLVLSPALYRWVVTNTALELPALYARIQALGR